MDNFQPDYVKKQAKAKEDAEKSMWTLSYRIKGMAIGALVMYGYMNFYMDQDSPKMIVAGGVLGYFFGWLVGSFFYTKK